ncbi:MAG: hypothetical protein ACC700_20835, partial [Anaerolineales bacterium]
VSKSRFYLPEEGYGMDATGITTILIAIYGAGLSTVLGIREWKRSRPSLHITAKHGYVVDVNGKDGEYSEPVLVMKAANVGSGSIFLSGMGFVNKGGSKQVLTSPYPSGILPAELEEGRSVISAYACRWLREQVDHEKIVGVFFQDETGKMWEAKLDKDLKAFCLASVSDGWELETRHPLKPLIMTSKKPRP